MQKDATDVAGGDVQCGVLGNERRSVQERLVLGLDTQLESKKPNLSGRCGSGAHNTQLPDRLVRELWLVGVSVTALDGTAVRPLISPVGTQVPLGQQKALLPEDSCDGLWLVRLVAGRWKASSGLVNGVPGV
mmetsp:Transcript_72681/g.168402  ORF Transcript_72681/g.168402 Transcript_72681/m.168402 type:complete len:132 (+) Transcript_72681:253-648(+)